MVRSNVCLQFRGRVVLLKWETILILNGCHMLRHIMVSACYYGISIMGFLWAVPTRQGTDVLGGFFAIGT